MSSTSNQPLDSGFVRLSAMISAMGDRLRPVGTDVASLMEDTRTALAESEGSNRPRYRG